MSIIPFQLLDISNEIYHKQMSVEDHYFSSSQFKKMLEDPELFHKTYITKTVEQNNDKPAFHIGTYYHTAMLEPHLLDKECAVYLGRRAGKDWEEYQAANKGKAIINATGKKEADMLIASTKASPMANAIYSGGVAEKSLFVKIFVDPATGEIYHIGKEIWKLDTFKGWEVVKGANVEPLIAIQVKVRFDYANYDKGYIADLKSMSGDPGDTKAIFYKIKDLNYDMSAAQYIDMFNLWAIEDGRGPIFKEFYWTFASKTLPICQNYLCDEVLLQVGRAKFKKAVRELVKYTQNSWTFEEELKYIECDELEASKWLTDKPARKKLLTITKPEVEDEGLDLF